MQFNAYKFVFHLYQTLVTRRSRKFHGNDGVVQPIHFIVRLVFTDQKNAAMLDVLR